MATVDLTLESFESTILEGGTVFVDFWAGWCGPCLQFAPHYQAAAEANPDLVFAKVDTEAQQQLAAAMNITSIPTIMAFKDGIGVFAQAGALPRPVLDDLISQVRALDMHEVRAQLAKQETEQAMESSERTEDLGSSARAER
ncbi:thioredoxin family protein [Agromyces aerolatus]|uniref:thioredoxin family protein n=1 Tax=Agromyces sp. LY-1074 TaxID=3074080 RepID=UPI00285DC642|nr:MULTISPECIES: thioredoxin family protein [unclassified Agromyces]MDR5701062.1 thioredoxin family protein [Agromyces sp. LY-1074]MDR5707702.1 thioredoxin family protein [Agromyces sp. LY-1358]